VESSSLGRRRRGALGDHPATNRWPTAIEESARRPLRPVELVETTCRRRVRFRQAQPAACVGRARRTTCRRRGRFRQAQPAESIGRARRDQPGLRQAQPAGWSAPLESGGHNRGLSPADAIRVCPRRTSP